MQETSNIHSDLSSAEKFIISVLGTIKHKISYWPSPYKEMSFDYLDRLIMNDSLLKKFVSEASDNLLLSKNNNELDMNSLWRHVPSDDRTKLGQFFTPRELANHILDVSEQNTSDLFDGTGLVADIACGAGIFLQQFVHRQLAHQTNKILPAKILSRVIGVDKDPHACALAKLSIALEILNFIHETQSINRIGESQEKWPLPRIYCTDTLEYSPYKLNGYTANHIFNTEEFRAGLDLVVSNFPFLEAKRMNRYDPNLKQWLKERFPMLFGAFDLYVPFIYQALYLLKTDGILGVVLPDKFLIDRYAEKIRKHILDEHRLLQITDCSRVPRLFFNTGVYPIVLFVRKGVDGKTTRPKGVSVSSLNELAYARPYSLYPELFEMTGDNCTYFCRNSQWFELIKQLYSTKEAQRLGTVLDIRSTISFHRKGIREQFVKPKREWQSDEYPYLGGKSHTRENELDMFTVKWAGYYIYYPQNLKSLVGHTMAPIGIFKRPKIIFCQHSQRLRAYFDVEGKFLAKDVYPIAFPQERYDPRDIGWLMTAYLNSSLLTIIYNTIYHGIIIAQGFYHYLPAFLKEIPVILPETTEKNNLISMAKELQEIAGEQAPAAMSKIPEIYKELDHLVSKVHNLSEEQHHGFLEYLKANRIPSPWEINRMHVVSSNVS